MSGICYTNGKCFGLMLACTAGCSTCTSFSSAACTACSSGYVLAGSYCCGGSTPNL